MTRLCYLHPVPLLTVRGKTACPACGTLYPAVEPICSAPAQLPRRVLSSPPVGGFYSQNPAQDRGQTGGLSGAVKAAKPTAAAEISSPELCRRSPHTPSARKQAARADAAPGRFTPQQAGPGTRTQET